MKGKFEKRRSKNHTRVSEFLFGIYDKLEKQLFIKKTVEAGQ